MRHVVVDVAILGPSGVRAYILGLEILGSWRVCGLRLGALGQVVRAEGSTSVVRVIAVHLRVVSIQVQ